VERDLIDGLATGAHPHIIFVHSPEKILDVWNLLPRQNLMSIADNFDYTAYLKGFQLFSVESLDELIYYNYYEKQPYIV
jgi:hypothetical protein